MHVARQCNIASIDVPVLVVDVIDGMCTHFRSVMISGLCLDRFTDGQSLGLHGGCGCVRVCVSCLPGMCVYRAPFVVDRRRFEQVSV